MRSFVVFLLASAALVIVTVGGMLSKVSITAALVPVLPKLSVTVATIEFEGPNVQAFTARFWEIVGRLRDAGNSAVERMVDRSESKAAADKFIRQFMKGDR